MQSKTPFQSRTVDVTYACKLSQSYTCRDSQERREEKTQIYMLAPAGEDTSMLFMIIVSVQLTGMVDLYDFYLTRSNEVI